MMSKHDLGYNGVFCIVIKEEFFLLKQKENRVPVKKQGLSYVASKQPSGFGVRRWYYYGGGSWNKASAFCLKERCFFCCTMGASGKRKKNVWVRSIS